MTYTCPEETQNFTLSFAEAMACHAYGGDFVSVMIEPEDIFKALLTLRTGLSHETPFDYLGYFSKSEELFGEEGRMEVTDVLLDFVSDRGIV